RALTRGGGARACHWRSLRQWREGCSVDQATAMHVHLLGGAHVEDGRFHSPTRGPLTFDQLIEDLMAFMADDPHGSYRLIVGTDSHTRTDLCFVTAIIVHRKGKGARFYYRRRRHSKMRSLRQRIFYEAALS